MKGIFVNDKGEAEESRSFNVLTSTLPVNAIEDKGQKFIDYFADVTEDLPGSCRFEPNTFKNCQLMTETPGGYLQFFDHQTNEVLKIAINSNIYSPLN